MSLAEDARGTSPGQPNVFVLRDNLEKALDSIQKIDFISQLGRTIFLFDPLRSVPRDDVEKVASRRITSFYQIGTEFIIFLFTSDLFLGRDEFAPLPTNIDENIWTENERESVRETGSVLGGLSWKSALLNSDPIPAKEERIVYLYKEALHKWFRYVLALPFAPKEGQIYHLFFCSNFEIGIRVTKNFYSQFTGNPRFSPDNRATYAKFKTEHPDKVVGFVGQRKPLEFKMLWKIIKEHEDGFCDSMCEDLKEDEPLVFKREMVLTWLAQQRYIVPVSYPNELWRQRWQTYKLNWSVVTAKLGVPAPVPLVPMLPSKMMVNRR